MCLLASHNDSHVKMALDNREFRLCLWRLLVVLYVLLSTKLLIKI